MSAPQTIDATAVRAPGTVRGPAEMTWGDLAAALRWKVEETLDRLNEAIKDALIDGELPLSPDKDWEDGCPLAPLSRERFVEVMRPRIEEALRAMADHLNGNGDADDIGELLEALLHDALRTGREMRSNLPAGETLAGQESPC